LVVSWQMARRNQLCLALAVLSLCAVAHPAFADGVFASNGGYLGLFLELLLVVALGILVAVFMLRWLIRIGRAAERRRRAKAAEPQIPAARVVESTARDRNEARDQLQ
jgi:uncharacterized membrane protein